MLSSSLISLFAAAGLVGRVKDVSKAAKPAPLDPVVREVTALVSAFTPPQKDARSLQSLYNSNPWVRSIVGRVSTMVARQPWYLVNPAGERVDSHPALDFIRKGSPRLPGARGIAVSQVQIDTAGEAFWIVGRDAKGQPASWGIVPPDRVQTIPEDDGPGAEYVVNLLQGGQRAYAAADVVWFRDVDPLDPYARGRSITGAMATELQADEAASEHVAAHLQNRARPDLIITGTEKSPIPERSLPSFSERWQQLFKGSSKTGRPFFSSTDINVKEVSKSLGDNDMANLRPELRAVITEVYGVPPEVFGRIENSNRSTIDSAQYLLATYSIDPRLWALKSVLEPFVLANFAGLAGWSLEYETPIKDDVGRRLDVMRAAPKHYFTGNDWRRLAEVEPIDGLDDLPPEPMQPTPVNPDDKTPKKNIDQTNHVSHTGDATQTKALSPDDVIQVSAAHEAPSVRADVTAIVDSLYVRLVERYGAGLLSVLESDVNFAVNSSVVEWLRAEIPDLFDQIDSTTRAALEAALVDGVASAEIKDKLAARIDAIFADALENRTTLISETEATKLAGFTSLSASKQAGFTAKEWLTSADQKVRASHKELDGQKVGIDEAFATSDGARAQHPGAFGKPEEDINCRCAIRPVLPGEKSARAAIEPWHAKMLAIMSGDIRKTMRDVFARQRRATLEAFERATVGA